MNIREAIISDINKIHKLGESIDEFNTTEKVVTFWPKHILRNCIKSKTDWLLIAQENSKIIGFIICNNSPIFKKAVIENIYVSPLHQRKKVGEKLLKSLFKKIESTDCEYIVVFTEDNNSTALDFFIKNGLNKGKKFIWIDKVLSKEFKN